MKNSLHLALVCWLLVTAHVASAQINLSFSHVSPTCNGFANGSATVVPSDGNAPYSFLWENGQQGQTNQGIGAGVHAVTVTDASNLTASGNVTVTQPSALTVDVTVTDVACASSPFGGAVHAVVLGGVAPYTYLWNDNNTDASRENLAAGTYSVTVTDINGCTAIDQGTVTMPPPLDVVIVAINPACGGANNGSATIFVTGGVPPYTHTWTPGGFTGTTVTGLAPGQYYVCTFDANHCQKDLWVTIPSITSLDVHLAVLSAECTGIDDGVVTAIVNPPGNYNYEWNLPPFQGVTQLTGLPGNTPVSVTVTDPTSGCSGTASVIVGVHNAISVAVTDTDIQCAGQNTGTATATAIGGTPVYQYQWLIPPSGPQIGLGPTINNLSTGAYMVSVTDSRGCTAIGVANIGIESGPIAIIGGASSVTCDTSESVIQFTNLSTDAFGTIVSWMWTITTPNDTMTFSNISPLQLTLPVGVIGTAQLSVTSANGCMAVAVDTFNVPGVPNIALNTGPTVVACNSEPVPLIVTGGQPWYTYVWSPLTGLTLDSVPPNAVANPSTTTTYQLIASDHGCNDTVSVEIIRLDSIDLFVEHEVIETCDSTVTLLATANVPNVIWINAAGVVIPGGNPVTVVAGAPAVYTAIATSPEGCVDSVSVTVIGSPSITLSTGGTAINCDNGPVPIIVTGGGPGFTYIWSPLTGLVFDQTLPSVTANPTETTTYQLIANSPLGCSDTISVTVVRVVPIELSVEYDVIETCDTSVQLLATSNVTNVVWIDATGQIIGQNPVNVTVLPGSTVVYTAIATDTTGCVDSISITVHGNPAITLSTGPVALDCNNGPIPILVSGGGPNLTYVWSPTTGLIFDLTPPSVTANPTETTTYQLIASSPLGCNDTVSVTIVRVVPIILTVENAVIETCDTTVQLLATSNVPNVVWVDAAGNIIGQNPVNVSVLPGSTVVYTAIATDTTGCVDSISVTVHGIPAITLSTGPVAIDCNNGPIPIIVSGGGPSLTYVWSPTTGLIFDLTPPNVTANPTETTTYQLIASSPLGCNDTVSVTVVRVVPIILTVENAVIETCDTTVQLLATSNVPNVVWVDAAGNIIGQNPVNVSVLPGSTVVYTAIATDTTGCVDSISVTVHGIPAITLSTGPVAIDCNNGPIPIIVSGGGPSLTYVWSPTTGLIFDLTPPNVTANPTETTTYQLIASSPLGCNDTVSVTIVRVVPIILTVENAVIETCDTTVQLLATSNVPNVVWVDAAGNIIGQNPINVSVLPGSTVVYTAIATDTTGCVDSISVTVHGIPTITLSTGPMALDCNNGPIPIIVSGGGPSLTYVWSPTTGLVFDLTPPSVTANPTETTTYQLIASSPLGCIDTVSVTVVRVTPIELSVVDDEIQTCDTTAVLLASSNVPNVIWVNAGGEILPGGNPVTVNAGATAIYTAIATDPLTGCVDSLPVSVTGLPHITLNTGPVALDCQNGPVQLIVTGGSPGYTYVWSPLTGLVFDLTLPNVTANPSVTTTYQLIASSQLRCDDTLTVTVVRVIPIELSVEQDVIESCDSTVVLLATANVPNVVWVNANGVVVAGGNPVTVPVGDPVMYTAIATDPLTGCVDSVSVAVSGVGPDVSVDPDLPLTGCAGADIQLGLINNIPGDVLQYQWSVTAPLVLVGNQTPNPTVSGPAGVYNVTVTVTNQRLCTQTLIIPIEILELTTIEQAITADLCNGTIVSFLNTSGFQGIWSFGDGGTSPVDNPTHTYASAGIYQVVFTPANAVCVMPWDSLINVQAFPLLPPMIAHNYQLCVDSAKILFNGIPDNPNVKWDWAFTNGLPLTSNLQNQVVTFFMEGTITATLVITDLNGCTASAMQDVPVAFIHDRIPDNLQFCRDSSVQLNPDGVDPDVLDYVWTANPPDATLTNPTDKNPTVSPDVVTVYSLTITQGATCSATYQVTVTPVEGANLQLQADTVVCNDIPITVTASGNGSSYDWSLSPTFNSILQTGSSLQIQPDKNSVYYYVRTSNLLGCGAVDSIKVTNGSVVIEAEAYNICSGQDTMLLVSNSNPEYVLFYQWTPALPPVANPTVAPTTSTTYTVTVTNNQNICTAELSIEVNVTSVGVTAEVTGDDVINVGESTTLEATPSGTGTVISYSWEPGSSLNDPTIFNPVASPVTDQTYTVTVVTSEGCVATDSVVVRVGDEQCVEPYIFVPKAFTPNNDANNDFFIVKGVGITELVFIVWDRWGEKVYQTDDPNALGWDGTYRGQELTPDSYAWYLRARCGNGAIYESKGDVTLLK